MRVSGPIINSYSTKSALVSTLSHRARYTTTMPETSSQVTARESNASHTKDKRGSPTHFLCFPLVTDVSLPLLEKSFANFKDNIPLRPRILGDPSMKPRPPLFPDSAIRPLGTLHLTLGVMSLQTPERVNEAVNLLHSLDIEQMLRETELEIKNNTSSSSSTQQQLSDDTIVPNTEKMAPISVSLESLYALPRAKAATVLYAKPVDPTSRLYPFSVKLRQIFMDAGLLLPEYTKKKKKKNPHTLSEKVEDIDGADETILQGSPKLRPLLLHATVVNTIYARGGNHTSQPNRGRGDNNKRRGGPLIFDARDMITRHHDFYTDDTCVEEKEHVFDIFKIRDEEASSSESNDDGDDEATSEQEAHPSRNVQQITPEQTDDNSNNASRTKYPYIWARNVHIEKLCICEMGAKKLDEDSDPMAARLGQKYRVVAERSLLGSNHGEGSKGV